MSEVRSPRRARSWITRSSPSYAKRCAARGFPLGVRIRIAIRFPITELQYRGNEHLPDAERYAHGPRRKCARSQRKTGESCHEIPDADREHLRGQDPTGGEHPETEDDLPQTGQH